MGPKKKSSLKRASSASSLRGSQIKVDDPERDESVKYAWDTIWQGLGDHITDKQFYPHYVAHAVANTVAQMVQLLCYNQLTRMDDWDHPIAGQHLDEWDEDQECLLPPIDSWARQCIPMELKAKPPSAFDDAEFKSKLANGGGGRRLSADVLNNIEGALAQRRNSAQLQLQPRRATEPENLQVESERFFKGAVLTWSQMQDEESEGESSDGERDPGAEETPQAAESPAPSA